VRARQLDPDSGNRGDDEDRHSGDSRV